MHLEDKKKKKPLLLSVLVTYWIALIPLIAVLLLSYLTYQRYIERRNLEEQTFSVQTAAKTVDAQLKNAAAAASTLLINNDNVRELRASNDMSESDLLFQLWKSQKDLFMQRNLNSLLKAIYLYFPSQNAMLSTDSIYIGEAFQKNCEKVTGISYEAWTELNNLTGSLRYYIVDGVGQSEFVILQRYFPIASSSHNAVTCSLVDRGQFLNQIRATAFMPDTSYALLDTQNHIYGDAALSNAILEKLNDVEGAQQFQIEDAVVNVTPLTISSSIRLVSLVPMSSLTSSGMGTLQMIITVAFAVGVIVTGVLTFIYARRQVEPIERIHQLITAGTPVAVQQADRSVYQEIALGIDHMLAQLETTNGRLKSQQEAKRSRRLLQMLRDRDDTEEHIRSISKGLGIVWESGRIAVISIFVSKLPDKLPYQEDEQDDDALDTILNQVILTAITSVLSPEIACRPATDETRAAYVLSGIPRDMTTQALTGCLETVQIYLRDQLTADVMIAIGHIDDSLTGLQSSYRQARTTLEYMRMSMPDRNVMSYEEMEHLPNAEMPVERSFQIQRKFLNQMQVEDYDNAYETLMTLLDQNSGAVISPIQMMSLESTLSYALSTDERAFADSTFVAIYAANVVKLRNCQTQEEAGLVLRDIFAAVQDTRADVIAPGATIVSCVVDYTQQHYTSPDISIGAIADHFGVSISYISRQFKRSYGIGLLEYIHALRIEEAKRLLANTNKSIKDIATDVGFINSLTLSRSFKRHEGILPSEYRNISRQEKDT